MTEPAADAARIGPTAHYTAYVWRRLGLPYAEHLATPMGAALYWGFFAMGEWTTRALPGVPTMRDFLAYRHLLIDALVEQLEPDLLVELGAGLTPRTLQWALDRGVATVDVDLPPMITLKRRAISRMPPALGDALARQHRLLGLDVLAADFSCRLANIVSGARRPVVVAEGLVGYFDVAARRSLFAAVGRALGQCGGGSLVVDLHTAAAQAAVGPATAVLRSAIRLLTRRRHALDPFLDTEAYRGAFLDAGFAGVRELVPADFIAARPALAGLCSPAHIVHAWIE